MARLDTAKQVRILSSLVEGSSIRSTERMTGAHRDTIMKLILRWGRASERLLDEKIRGVRCSHLQLDELWCFVNKKRNHLRPGDDPTFGDAWTWTALDPETKLVPAFHVGKRGEADAVLFVHKLRSRVEGRVQISTDKLAAYRWAIASAWGYEELPDWGRIVKRYRVEPASFGRYSPPVCIGVNKDAVFGDPDMDRISTSHVERQNLTVRMGLRRFTRLTNGFSKKVDNLRAAVALHFAYYNFVRKHSSIKTTPAVAAGLDGQPMTLPEFVEWGELYGR